MTTPYTLEELLSEKQTCHVVRQWMTERNLQGPVEILSSEVKKFADGLTGFLGDHLRVTLQLKVQGTVRKAHLFVKCLPMDNKPKSELISDWNFFVREMVMYQIFEEFGGTDGKNAWRPKSYICNESIVVMPDLTAEGFITYPKEKNFDLDHTLLTVASIARFHAAQVNSDASRPGSEKCITEKYGHLITECNFLDTAWLRSGAKLTSNVLKQYSTKPYSNKEMESLLIKQYIEACDSIKEYPNELNVIIHKDLWSNNIFFKYNNSKPVTCLLIDYQCVRIAPPAFDVLIFLYLNTSAKTRALHEKDILLHYYNTFISSLVADAKKKHADYTLEAFAQWCERARKAAMLVPIMIFPFVLMDSKAAQKTYDDPATYDHYVNVDRSKPVLEYAEEHPGFRERMLEVSEEFVERFIFGRV